MLDSYTEGVVELQRQLTAELTARQKQYEFYRDKLLTFDVLRGGEQLISTKEHLGNCLISGTALARAKSFLERVLHLFVTQMFTIIGRLEKRI